MKANKYGKIQKDILKKLLEFPEGCKVSDLYYIAFPHSEYTFSYLTPVLVRMEYSGLIQVLWEKNHFNGLVKLREEMRNELGKLAKGWN